MDYDFRNELTQDLNGALMQAQEKGFVPPLEGEDSINWTGGRFISWSLTSVIV